MYSKSYNVIGVMSGTSLDGVDLAHIRFNFVNGKITYNIDKAATIPYTKYWEDRLRAGVALEETELMQLDSDYTTLLSGYINQFISNHSIETPDAICSHGHTILHQPARGVTFQAGNLPSIAALTKQRVVCNFRVQDVALGGQGAPLVPIGDRLLFPEYDFCLNLGGFSNISFEDNGVRVAFDISPANIVLNRYAATFGVAYDDGGHIAAAGNCCHELLEELNGLTYYQAAWPKSLGLEFVIAEVLPLIQKYKISAADVLHTFTIHIAQQVSFALRGKNGRMLVTGGGAYNTFLITQMKNVLPHIEVIVPDGNTVQFKEALVFGLLGVLRMRDEDNVLASVTGASRNHCAGFIYEP